MAEETSGLTELFQALPGPLQGILAVAVAVGFGFTFWRRFMRSLRGEVPDSREMFIGGPTTFADLEPIRTLIKSVDNLVQQEMKTEAAVLTAAGALTAAAQALASIATDATEFLRLMHEDRDKRESDDTIKGLMRDMRLDELEEKLKARKPRRRATPRPRPQSAG